MTKKQQCSEKVWRGYGMSTPCSRPGVVRENDKPWCRQHAPSAVKARQKTWQAKWDAEKKAGKATTRIKAAEAKVVQAAVGWGDAEGTNQASIAVLADALITLKLARQAAKQ